MLSIHDRVVRLALTSVWKHTSPDPTDSALKVPSFSSKTSRRSNASIAYSRASSRDRTTATVQSVIWRVCTDASPISALPGNGRSPGSLLSVTHSSDLKHSISRQCSDFGDERSETTAFPTSYPYCSTPLPRQAHRLFTSTNGIRQVNGARLAGIDLTARKI